MEFDISSLERSGEETSGRMKTRRYDGIRSGMADRGDAVRQEVGYRMFDLLTEYFPEEYAARRRSELGQAFGIGVVTGVITTMVYRKMFGRKR